MVQMLTPCRWHYIALGIQQSLPPSNPNLSSLPSHTLSIVSLCRCGSMFSGTTEAPGEYFFINGVKVKVSRVDNLVEENNPQ